MEVVWKMVMVIINCCLSTSISLQDVLHRFWGCRRTGTASLKAKLIQHLTAMNEKFLYPIFMDL